MIASYALLIITFQFYADKITEAINCKPFTTEEAKFAAENFYKIPMNREENELISKNLDKKVTAAEIVENFDKNLEKLIFISSNKNIEKGTILKNGRKIVTIATDLCNTMPKKEDNGLPMASGFISCVEFLLYQHMQRLVWRLVHKWGINWRSVPLADQQNFDENNFNNENNNNNNDKSLLQIYTAKKANAWQKIRFIYRNELDEFLEGQSERIRRKFGFCLIIDGQMRLKCEPIREESAFFFLKNFHKIPIFEPKFERNKAQMVEDMATNLFNALKWEHKKFVEQKMGENNLENEKKNKNKIAEMKGWRSAEQWAMKVRLKVLANTAGEKCRTMRKKLSRFLNKIGTKIGQMFRKNEKSEAKENAVEIDRDFIACIYHYLYSFSLNLAGRMPGDTLNDGENGVEQPSDQSQHRKSDQKEKMEALESIYEKLREKIWQKMQLAYAGNDLAEMDAWLRGSSDQSGDDPFQKCAAINGVGDQQDEPSMFGTGDMDTTKSFDQHLMPCIGQFLDAMANDQFQYQIFVNFYTKQLESAIEFPDQMAKKFVQKAQDSCYFMREVLASLNKNITNRLNFEKITKRSEKEQWVELHEKLEELLMKREDKRWIDRLRRNVRKNAENLRQTFQRWSAMANPIKHPIRDECRRARQLIRRVISPTAGGTTAAADHQRRTIGGGRREQRDTTHAIVDQQALAAHGAAKEEEDKALSENETETLEDERTVFQQKIDQKIIKVADQIVKHPLSKRIELYEKFYKAFNIALALELIGRYETNGPINLQFVFGTDNDQLPGQSVKIGEQLNFQKIKSPENLRIFDEIAKRMGKKLTKGQLKLFSKKKSENFGKNCENETEKEKDENGRRKEKLHAIVEEGEEEHGEGEEEKEKGKEAKKEEQHEESVEGNGTKMGQKEMAKGNGNKIEEEKAEDEAAERREEKRDWEITEEKVEDEAEEKRDRDESRGSVAAEDRLEVAPFVSDEQQKLEDKRNGVGFELAHLGYLYEKDGGELLNAFMEEMKLNMDQFGMSWDSDCDMSDDLNQCLLAADGLDFDEQLFRFSLLGKQRDEMGTLERVVESLFKTLSRWSYKFGQKSKSRRTFLARFYYVNIYGINEGLARLMSGQISPFEVFVPFYMRMKRGAKFVVKKVVATSVGQAFRAWMLKLFNSLNATLKGREKEIGREMKNGMNIERMEMPKNGVPPQIMSDDRQFNERINPLLSNIAEQTQREFEQSQAANSALSQYKMPIFSGKFSSNFKRRDKKAANFKKESNRSKPKLATKLGKAAQTLRDFFIDFIFEKLDKSAKERDKNEGICENNKRGAQKGASKRKKREAFERGAAITAHIRQGKMGSSTVRSIIFNSRLIDTSIPGLHLHWLHANAAALLLGKYSLVGHLPSALLFSFVIGSMLFWWHAVKLAVYMAMLHGDMVGWAVLLIAAALYICVCTIFII